MSEETEAERHFEKLMRNNPGAVYALDDAIDRIVELEEATKLNLMRIASLVERNAELEARLKNNQR